MSKTASNDATIRMKSWSWRSETGYATVEFALIIPALILVLILSLGALGAGAAKLQGCAQARSAARAVSVGIQPSQVTGFLTQVEEQGDWIVATTSTTFGKSLGIPQIKCEVSAMKEPDYATFY